MKERVTAANCLSVFYESVNGIENWREILYCKAFNTARAKKRKVRAFAHRDGSTFPTVITKLFSGAIYNFRVFQR